MNSKTNTGIKQRSKANDVFLTPINLIKIHIDLVKEYVVDGETIMDPFYGTGNYFNTVSEAFPNNTHVFTEIEMGRDFFEYKDKVSTIISNPPYSMIDAVLKHSIALEAHTISYLIGVNNLTAKRIEYMNANGYYLAKIHMTKVWKWFGMSFIVVFTKKATTNCMSFDRTVWKN